MRRMRFINALRAIQSGQLARPATSDWHGEALLAHGGLLYREPVDSRPAVSLTIQQMLAQWEVVTLEELVNERAGVAVPRRERRQRKAGTVTGGKRKGGPGRQTTPPAEPGWAGVLQAAAETGVFRDRIRRAVTAGTVRHRQVDGVLHVSLDDLRALPARGLGTPPAAPAAAPAPAETTAPVVADEPVAVEVESW